MTHVIIAANDHLKVMSMQVERMFAGVVVVEDDLYDFVLLQHERIGVVAVHCYIACVLACGHDAVQRWNHGRGVSDIVEKSAID